MKKQLSLFGMLTFCALLVMAEGGGSVGSSTTTQLPTLEMKWEHGGPNNMIGLRVERQLVQKEEGNPDLVADVTACRLDKPLTLGYRDLFEVNLVNLVFEGGKKINRGNGIALIWVAHNGAKAYGYGFQIKDFSLSTNGKNVILEDVDIISGFSNSYSEISQGLIDFLGSAGIKVPTPGSQPGNAPAFTPIASTYEKSVIEKNYPYEDYKDHGASGLSFEKTISATYAMSLVNDRGANTIETLRTFFQVENNQLVSVKIRGYIDGVDQTLCLKSADLAAWRDTDKNYIRKLLP